LNTKTKTKPGLSPRPLMHEYSLVQALLDRVDREVAAHRGTKVHRLWVRIGELSPLEVTRQEARWVCPRCETPVARGERLVCAACETPARLVAGDELMLDRIELEVA
jgi:Zn finger protein HypA/HybF involved in hydrogenase expression